MAEAPAPGFDPEAFMKDLGSDIEKLKSHVTVDQGLRDLWSMDLEPALNGEAGSATLNALAAIPLVGTILKHFSGPIAAAVTKGLDQTAQVLVDDATS
jgi:hypothetical protein